MMVQSNIISISVTSSTTAVESGYILANPDTVSLSEDLTIEGHNFFANKPITLYDSLGGQSQHTTDSSGSFTTGQFSIASVTQSPGNVEFWATDDETGYTSPKITVVVSGISSTTSSGYVLPPSEWTGTGAYGSNTNPIAFGNWAIAPGDVEYSGPGYYQNEGGTAEMYASSESTLSAYLQSIGYEPTSTQPTLTASPESVALGGTITFSVSGLTPNGTWKLYDYGPDYFDAAAITGSLALDSSGSGTLVYTVAQDSPLYQAYEGGITSFHAVDDTGLNTNGVTISIS